MSSMPPGRPPNPDKQPLPPKLSIYWESAELRDAVEDFILQQQAAGKLARKTPRGQRYGVSHYVMDAIRKKLEADLKNSTS